MAVGEHLSSFADSPGAQPKAFLVVAQGDLEV